MIACFAYKAVRNSMSYCLLISLILVAVLTGEGVKGSFDYTPFQKLANWPFSCDIFLEFILVAGSSWLVLSDLMNGTYKNIIAGGVSRRKYFLSQLGCIAGMTTLNLLLATLCYIELLKEQEVTSSISIAQWHIYVLYLFLIWIQHMTVVLISAALAFAVRKLYMVIVSVLVLFSLMLFGMVATVHQDLTWIVKVFQYLPYGMGKMLHNQIFMDNPSMVNPIVNILPSIVFVVIVIAIAMKKFERADLN